jgi:hypothetical protein
MTAVTVCRRCRRLISYDPNGPDEVTLDPELCMECIFDDEEGLIVRGQN